MTWVNDVRRANDALDWIEARQGPLNLDGYARIETDVRTVRAMAEGQDDDARVQEIRNVIHACVAEGGPWLLDGGDAVALLTRLDALAAEASDVARENEALIEEVKAAGEQITALAAERDELRADVLRLIEVRDRAVDGADHAFAERDAAVARAERAESERDVYRDALTLISRGVWTARNSVESIVWGARKALRDGAALAAASEDGGA